MLLDTERTISPPRPAGPGPAAAGAARQPLRPQPQSRLLSAAGLPRLTVQHLVLSPADVEQVALALQQAGRQLGVELVMDARDGDIVLLDSGLAAQMSAQLIAAFREGRPCLVVEGLRGGPAAQPGLLEVQPAGQPLCQGRPSSPPLRRQLRQQLLALPMLWPLLGPRSAAADRGPADAADDSVWPLDVPEANPAAAGLQLLQQLAKRRGDPAAAPLRASYGPGADLHVDFATARVHAEPRALQLLRLHQDLPVLVPDLAPRLQTAALPLDQALWDLGSAAAPLPMLGAPVDGWQTPLMGCGAAAAGSRFTRVPRFLDVLRRLDAGPVSAAELRREGRVNATDLRHVLQPCLLLGLARWCAEAGAPAGAAGSPIEPSLP